MSKVDPSKISLNCINILKSSISSEESFCNNPVIIKQSRVGIHQSSKFDFVNKLVSIKLNIALNAENDEKQLVDVNGEFSIEFVIRVDNLDEFIEQGENDTLLINGELGASLMGIVYSTARGIILEKTVNTPLNGVILPVINPSNLLTNSET
jgi:hypothetical protein